MPPRRPKLHRSLRAEWIRPATCEPVVRVMPPKPLAPRFARGPSVHVPAASLPDFHTPPTVHMRKPPKAASVHPDTALSSRSRPRPQDSGEAFAVARVAFRQNPYLEREWPASH